MRAKQAFRVASFLLGIMCAHATVTILVTRKLMFFEILVHTLLNKD